MREEARYPASRMNLMKRCHHMTAGIGRLFAEKRRLASPVATPQLLLHISGVLTAEYQGDNSLDTVPGESACTLCGSPHADM